MNEYLHIDSVYKRDQKGKFIIGEWSTPEFEYLADNPWLWTEKIDGTNIRIMWDGNEVRYGGKTDNAQIPAKLVNWLNEQIVTGITDGATQTFNPYVFHHLFGGEGNVCLYGEGYGAGIQKSGGLYSAEQKFILFDVKIGHWWLKRNAVEDIAQKLNLEIVPTIQISSLTVMIASVEALAKLGGLNSTIGTAKAEGYVGTPLIPLFNRKGERVITKIKYKDFT